MKGSFHQTVSGVCVDLSYEGKGVFKAGDQTVFVPGMFIGEEGEVEIEYQRNGALFGVLRKLTKVSPDRIEPRCKICSSCGGCSFQQLFYPAQLSFKAKAVEEQFRKIAKMEIKAEPCLGMETPYFYRNKIQMPFGKDRRGNVYCGFYKERSHVIVPVEQCYIEDEAAKPILDEIKKLCSSLHIEPYVEAEHYGWLRHVMIRVGKYSDQVMVVLVGINDSFPKKDPFVRGLLKACPNITTIVQNINPARTNVILGERERVLYGPGKIKDTLCGLSFLISAKSFYQTNPVMTEVLYRAAIEAAKLTKDDVVFDAYSGIGTIGLIAAKSCKEVISVEVIPEAVNDAKENAKRNGIENFLPYCADASSFMVAMAKKKQSVDVLFMDPPRKGADERFLKAALALKPRRIVYVSCNPSTLARDVQYLSKSYAVENVQPVDLFPQTPHVETVVLLQLKA